MKNPFLEQIRAGKIHSLADLKGAYHRAVMKTHPDVVGSDRLIEEFIRCSDHYEAAKKFISRAPNAAASDFAEAVDYRLSFYKEFYSLERLDKPYAFRRDDDARREIERAKRRAFDFFSRWRPDQIELYAEAGQGYDQIKQERSGREGRAYSLLFNLSSLFHNILGYQLSGSRFYKIQVKQNLSAVMARLDERNLRELRDFIHFLMADMDDGPAIHAAHLEQKGKG